MRENARHFILGTAGHVDHGKTSLIRALTGFDCDTHQEEKRRGITISLGFTHLKLSDEISLGIVDVPGHADFIHTMVGGVTGIDLVMLVIAADSGVMPQTREHLQIMQALDVKHGFVVLTKSDLLDDEIRELMRLEVEEFVAGTFLEKMPILSLSAQTGEGLDALRALLIEQCEKQAARRVSGPFRSYIDRIFTVSGHGTVVTGSAISGSIKVDESVWLLPDFPHTPLRVRALQRYGEAVSEVSAGDRVSLNLSGLARSDYRRGQLVSNHPLRSTQRIDAEITLFEAEQRRLKRRSQVIFHAGTRSASAIMRLLDKDQVKAGESALVQITLNLPFTLRADERFILRNSSDTESIGGGRVLDILPLHHRKRSEQLRKTLHHLAEASPIERLVHEVRKARRPLSCSMLAERTNHSVEEIRAQIKPPLPKEIFALNQGARTVLYTRAQAHQQRQAVLAALTQFRAANPLLEQGITFDELRSRLKLDSEADDALLTHTLSTLVEKKKINQVGRTWLPTHDIAEAGSQSAEAVEAVLNHVKSCGVKVPLLSEMSRIVQKLGLSEREFRQVLAYLVTIKELVRIDDDYLYAPLVDQIRTQLVAHLSDHPEGITVAAFRDLIGANRKFCLLLFSLFDQEKLTRREGDLRFLVQP